MIYGKFVDMFKLTEMPQVKEKIHEVSKGYLRVSWREGKELFTGYLLFDNNKIVGAIAEKLSGKKIIEGTEATRVILDAVHGGKVWTVEVYKTDIKGILSNRPGAVVECFLLREIPGNDLEDLLRVLNVYSGVLMVQDGETSWNLHVEGGLIKAAKSSGQIHLKGDRALKALLNRMGNVIRGGHYSFKLGEVFSPNEKVRNSSLFREGVSLLNEKLKTEDKFKRNS